MTTKEYDFLKAKNVCERWLNHINQQRETTETLQKAASLARSGDREEAMKLKSKVDSQPKIFDGANLLSVIDEIQFALEFTDKFLNGKDR